MTDINLMAKMRQKIFGRSLATNKAAFIQALGFIAQQRHHDEQQIALHISCHGNEKGIELTSNEFIYWSELGTILVGCAREALAYHECTKLSTVLLCMSACSGLAACEMAENETRPFMSLVAPNQAVPWSDCLVSFLAFYNLFLIKNSTLGEAVRAMNSAVATQDMFQVVDFSDDLRNALQSEANNNS